MSNIFTKSKNFKSEYSCAVVRIGKLTPIEGSDFLAKTDIFGVQIVVRKDQTKIVKMNNGSFDQPYVFMGVKQNKCLLVDKKGCLHYVNGNAGIWESNFENATLSCTKEQKEQLRQFINNVKKENNYGRN